MIEIWNLVFMQYNRKANGTLEVLPNKHIDTGMGFERLCMVLQGVSATYDTDVFAPIIKKIESISNTKYKTNHQTDVAIRVVADHLRAVTFSIADGQLPTNTGAGYVIRRILRRAIRYGFTFLNQKHPFICKLVEVIVQEMGEAFPELKAQQQLIENVIKEEEQSFLNTLDQGLILLDKIIKASSNNTINGAKAFELYDTYGFPLDLTQLIAKENDYKVDVKAFNIEMQKQKERSRVAANLDTSDWVILNNQDANPFIGYDILEIQAIISRYRKVSSNKEGDFYQIVFNTTPFYPEGGGQVGDTGYIQISSNEKIEVIDTKKENNLILHITKQLPSKTEGFFKLIVNKKKRQLSACNHTATHLLHNALREVLGPHVEQKGSLVRPQNLRFDFSHFSKVTDIELNKIETIVNTEIKANLALIEERNTTLKNALDQGALALFGEKYGNTVRTIRFGNSIELCGGTHVNNTSEIWYFKILSESAVASGIRRIEAITSHAALNYFMEIETQFQSLKEILKNTNHPVDSVKSLMNENQALKKQIEGLQKEKSKTLKSSLLKEINEINGVKFLAKEINLEPQNIKDLCFELGKDQNNLFLFFGTNYNNKAILSCYISKELVASKNLNAGQIIKNLGKHIQGGGGGQPFFATAGGTHIEGIKIAIEQVTRYLG